MALSSQDMKKVSSRIYSCLNLIVGIVLIVAGLAMWKVGTTTVDMINTGLTEQKLFFPPAGDPTFSAEAFPAAQKYAGKQVKDGSLAQAYADDFLGVQSKLVGQGKVSSEVGEALAADPTNVMLQQQQATMFQLDTSQALVLSAYGNWMMGKMMKMVGMIALIGGAVLVLWGLKQWMAYKRSK